MKYLSKEDELEIRAMLDSIRERLYSEHIHYEDLYSDLNWTYKTVTDLLFVVYMLKKERGCEQFKISCKKL